MSNESAFQKLEMREAGGEVALQSSRDELILLRETNHRFANTLSMLASILRREFASSISAEARSSFARCEARIVAFGKLHRSLIVGGLRGNVSISDYMEGLCRALSDALLKPLGIKCEFVAEAGDYPAECCEKMGLVVAELVTNAARHAFEGRCGTVRVSVLEDSGSLICGVADDGTGISLGAPGIGSLIVEQLVCAIGGEMIVKSGRWGTSVVVTRKSAAI